MCKMSILGRGSMKDHQKEEELKASGDPKYGHLSEDLHVEISAFGPPAEAHARMAFALAEVRKYLIPDKNDSIRQEQLRELESISGSSSSVPPSFYRNSRMMKSSPDAASFRPPPVMRTATRAPVVTPRVMPAKIKIMSILDRARLAMEESYGYEEPVNSPGPYHSYRSYEAPPSPIYDYSAPEYYRKSPPPRYGRHPAF
ncbi:hypothetical protein HHI36_016109 [Cryptolaemus montrouzieri]|uniref:Uncharacterized protein n=1 Tax=Cryptolaemus montrouzieri TaxID=559131 RepID=A0ABD2NIU5_9CUCU